VNAELPATADGRVPLGWVTALTFAFQHGVKIFASDATLHHPFV
jgi:hypothetical protein